MTKDKALKLIELMARDARSLLEEDEYPWYELKEIEETAQRAQQLEEASE